jgi:hypothetical protein
MSNPIYECDASVPLLDHMSKYTSMAEYELTIKNPAHIREGAPKWYAPDYLADHPELTAEMFTIKVCEVHKRRFEREREMILLVFEG